MAEAQAKQQDLLTKNLFLLGIVLSCALLLTFQNLPFLDYPNHLSRYYMLTRDFDTPLFRQYYETNFRIIPNIGVDLVMGLLGRIVDPALGLRLLLCGTVCLSSFGYAKLSLKRNDGRWHPALILLPLTFFSYSLVLGFLNFVFASALLPIGVYWFERFDKQSARTSLVFIFTMVLFFCHMFAAVLFLAIIATKLVFESKGNSRTIGLANIAVTFLVMVALYKLSTVSDEHSAIVMTPFLTKIKYLFSFMVIGPFWKVTSGLAFLGFAIIFGLWFKPMPREDKWLIGALLLVFAACPEGFKLSGNFDGRIPAILFSFLIAFARFQPENQPKWRNLAPFIFAIIATTNLASLFVVIRKSDVEARKIRGILQVVPAGDALFIADLSTWRELHRDTWYPTHRMLPFYTAIDRPLFISGMFTYPSQQPVVLRKELKQVGFATNTNPEGTPIEEQINLAMNRLDEKFAMLRKVGVRSAWVIFINYQSSGFPNFMAAPKDVSFEAKYQDETYTLFQVRWNP